MHVDCQTDFAYVKNYSLGVYIASYWCSMFSQPLQLRLEMLSPYGYAYLSGKSWCNCGNNF